MKDAGTHVSEVGYWEYSVKPKYRGLAYTVKQKMNRLVVGLTRWHHAIF